MKLSLSRFWRPGIRLQLTLFYTAAFALLILVSDILLYTQLQSSLVGSLDTELRLRAQQIADDISEENGTLRLRETTSELPGFDPADSYQQNMPADVNFDTIARILDSNGKIFRVSPAFHSLQVPIESITQPMHGVPWQGTVTTRDRQMVRLYSRAMTDEGQTIAIVQVGVSLTQLNTTLQSVIIEQLLIAPFVLLLGALGSFWLASRAIKPISRLTRTAQRIQAGDLQQRVPVPVAEDEVKQLALTLNEMIASLDKAFARQRRFVAEASHELRTPVAAIRSMTDIAMLEPLSKEKYMSVLRTINTEAERLGYLINDLLALARADEGQTHLEEEEVRLDILAEAVVANAEPLANEHGLTLRVTVTEPVVVLGDEARLIQMTMNLLDNAITYTPPGGHISVKVTTENDQACLSIRDTGIGIAPEHLPHIFERFYRVDPARTQTERTNSGLGLSIVEWVVRAHNGSISVESQPGPGSTFIVTLPLASSRTQPLRTRPLAAQRP